MKTITVSDTHSEILVTAIENEIKRMNEVMVSLLMDNKKHNSLVGEMEMVSNIHHSKELVKLLGYMKNC